MLLRHPGVVVDGLWRRHRPEARARRFGTAASARSGGGFSLINAIAGTAILAVVVAAIFSAGITNEHCPARNQKIAAPGQPAAEALPPPRAGSIASESGAGGGFAPVASPGNAATPARSLDTTEKRPAEDRDAVARALHTYRETGKLQTLRDSLLQSAEQDPVAALASLSGLPLSDRLKIDIGGEILGHWTDRAPREAAAWAEQNRWPGELGGPVAKVAEEWARRDPAAALLWAAGLEPGLDQVAALIAATSRWSKTDLHAVAGHVSSQLRGLPRDVMAGTLAREFGQEDPAAGLQWALAVDDPTGRERAAAGALADLHARDPAQAARLLQSAGLTPDFRQAVEKRVAGPLPWWH